jgi:hypothetical protein
MNVIKRSLCNVEVALIRVLNKLNGSRRVCIFCTPVWGAELFISSSTGREKTDLAGAGTVTQYVE